MTLHADDWTLDQWSIHVESAKNATKNHYTTIVADVRVIVAMDQEIQILRSQNEFLRQREQ